MPGNFFRPYIFSIPSKNLLNDGQFRVLKKCHRKFDCLVYEMLFIKELWPLSDSISVNVFV